MRKMILPHAPSPQMILSPINLLSLINLPLTINHHQILLIVIVAQKLKCLDLLSKLMDHNHIVQLACQHDTYKMKLQFKWHLPLSHLFLNLEKKKH